MAKKLKQSNINFSQEKLKNIEASLKLRDDYASAAETYHEHLQDFGVGAFNRVRKDTSYSYGMENIKKVFLHLKEQDKDFFFNFKNAGELVKNKEAVKKSIEILKQDKNHVNGQALIDLEKAYNLHKKIDGEIPYGKGKFQEIDLVSNFFNIIRLTNKDFIRSTEDKVKEIAFKVYNNEGVLKDLLSKDYYNIMRDELLQATDVIGKKTQVLNNEIVFKVINLCKLQVKEALFSKVVINPELQLGLSTNMLDHFDFKLLEKTLKQYASEYKTTLEIAIHAPEEFKSMIAILSDDYSKLVALDDTQDNTDEQESTPEKINSVSDMIKYIKSFNPFAKNKEEPAKEKELEKSSEWSPLNALKSLFSVPLANSDEGDEKHIDHAGKQIIISQVSIESPEFKSYTHKTYQLSVEHIYANYKSACYDSVITFVQSNSNCFINGDTRESFGCSSLKVKFESLQKLCANAFPFEALNDMDKEIQSRMDNAQKIIFDTNTKALHTLTASAPLNMLLVDKIMSASNYLAIEGNKLCNKGDIGCSGEIANNHDANQEL